MSGSDGDAFLIQNRADVVRVNVVNHERQHAELFTRGADNAHAFDRGNLCRRIDEQLMFVGRGLFPADDAQIINGRAQANLGSDRGRARFKLVRQVGIDRLLERDALNHVAAALKGLHLFQ